MPDKARRAAKRKKRRGAVYTPIAFALILAALIFGMSVFFRVSRIEVVGNSMYTQQEVMDAAGIEKGDNLFFFNRSAAVSSIYSRLPYIENAYVSRALPNKVTIEVRESRAIAVLTTQEGAYWAIDRNCKALRSVTLDEAVSLIRVDGLLAIAPMVGDIIEPGVEDAPKVEYLAEILYQISERGMAGDVTWLDMLSAVDPSFDYLGRFTVKLGTRDDTEYKFGMLVSAVAQLAPGDTGTIDLSLSDDNKAHFRPQ